MIDVTPTFSLYVTIAATALVAIAMITAAGLSGWRSWLALKHQELDTAHAGAAPMPNAGARIELADLKERIRKLEAIAAGVDL